MLKKYSEIIIFFSFRIVPSLGKKIQSKLEIIIELFILLYIIMMVDGYYLLPFELYIFWQSVYI